MGLACIVTGVAQSTRLEVYIEGKLLFQLLSFIFNRNTHTHVPKDNREKKYISIAL